MLSYEIIEDQLNNLTPAALAELWNEFCSPEYMIYRAQDVPGWYMQDCDGECTEPSEDVSNIIGQDIENLAEWLTENPALAEEYGIELKIGYAKKATPYAYDYDYIYDYSDDTVDALGYYAGAAIDAAAEYAELPKADKYPLKWRLVRETQHEPGGDAWQETLGEYSDYAAAFAALRKVAPYKNGIAELKSGYPESYVIYIADAWGDSYGEDMPNELEFFVNKNVYEFGRKGWTVRPGKYCS